MLLIDGDIMLYNSIHKTVINVVFDDEWVGPFMDMRQAKARIDVYIKDLKTKLDPDDEHPVVIAWSDHEGCFRKAIDSSYKQNRTGKKPGGWHELEAYVSGAYKSRRMPLLEADDVLGILATTHVGSIIVSDDKDLQTIPGKLYRPRQAKLAMITRQSADLYHLQQALEGDRVDDYPGCPGLGVVGAKRVLERAAGVKVWNAEARMDVWGDVVAAFEKKGQTEGQALVQARLARILRKADWVAKTKTVKLWEGGQ